MKRDKRQFTCDSVFPSLSASESGCSDFSFTLCSMLLSSASSATLVPSARRSLVLDTSRSIPEEPLKGTDCGG